MTSTQQVKHPRMELNIERPVINTIGNLEAVQNECNLSYNSCCNESKNNYQKGIRGKL